MMQIIHTHCLEYARGPNDHINIRISNSDSTAQYKADTTNNGCLDPYVYVVLWGSMDMLHGQCGASLSESSTQRSNTRESVKAQTAGHGDETRVLRAY